VPAARARAPAAPAAARTRRPTAAERRAVKPEISVVMSTWERPAHLALALAGFLRQTGGVAFELLVADDGSGPETGAVVDRFAARAPFPVEHVWHAREGHRRATILNLAVARASGEQVLYTDGDCVPAADLLAVHRREREKGKLLIGGYVRVRAEIGDGADEDWVLRGEHERLLGARERLALLRRHAKNVWQIRTRRRRRPHNLALNMSLARADLLRVNGYDEGFRGWGNVDGDLRERLKRAGVWPKSIWTKAVVYHLEHPVDPTRAQRAHNLARSRRADIPVFAEHGIVKPPGD
jgi:glycosyltransferase involved in cell wall biosynthesis